MPLWPEQTRAMLWLQISHALFEKKIPFVLEKSLKLLGDDLFKFPLDFFLIKLHRAKIRPCDFIIETCGKGYGPKLVQGKRGNIRSSAWVGTSIKMKYLSSKVILEI